MPAAPGSRAHGCCSAVPALCPCRGTSAHDFLSRKPGCPAATECPCFSTLPMLSLHPGPTPGVRRGALWLHGPAQQSALPCPPGSDLNPGCTTVLSLPAPQQGRLSFCSPKASGDRATPHSPLHPGLSLVITRWQPWATKVPITAILDQGTLAFPDSLAVARFFCPLSLLTSLSPGHPLTSYWLPPCLTLWALPHLLLLFLCSPCKRGLSFLRVLRKEEPFPGPPLLASALCKCLTS